MIIIINIRTPHAPTARAMGGDQAQGEGLQPPEVLGVPPWLVTKLARARQGGSSAMTPGLPPARSTACFVLGGALTCDLGLSGEMLGLLCPGGGMDSHAPVTPRADVVVFGGHLDDVLLAGVGVRDGVRCPI